MGLDKLADKLGLRAELLGQEASLQSINPKPYLPHMDWALCWHEWWASSSGCGSSHAGCVGARKPEAGSASQTQSAKQHC